MSKSLPPAKSPYSPRSPSRSLKEPARYGDDMRPSPLKEPRRSPVVKLGTSAGDFNVPGPGTYSASMDSYKNTPPSWTMGDKKARKSSLGGSSDSPRPIICGKDEASALKRYISPMHCKVFYGRGSPSPDTYTPLEQMGITDYTISNTSTHSPRYTFGTEIRPCAA